MAETERVEPDVDLFEDLLNAPTAPPAVQPGPRYLPASPAPAPPADLVETVGPDEEPAEGPGDEFGVAQPPAQVDPPRRVDEPVNAYEIDQSPVDGSAAAKVPPSSGSEHDPVDAVSWIGQLDEADLSLLLGAPELGAEVTTTGANEGFNIPDLAAPDAALQPVEADNPLEAAGVATARAGADEGPDGEPTEEHEPLGTPPEPKAPYPPLLALLDTPAPDRAEGNALEASHRHQPESSLAAGAPASVADRLPGADVAIPDAQAEPGLADRLADWPPPTGAPIAGIPFPVARASTGEPAALAALGQVDRDDVERDDVVDTNGPAALAAGLVSRFAGGLDDDLLPLRRR